MISFLFGLACGVVLTIAVAVLGVERYDKWERERTHRKFMERARQFTREEKSDG